MMRAAMKSLVFSLFLLLGCGAQSALACTDAEAGAHHVRTVAYDSAPTAVEFDRLVQEQHCDCPARAEVARAALTESEKFALTASFDSSAASPDAPYAELRRALAARGRSLSGTSPASALPPYLLTARLRC